MATDPKDSGTFDLLPRPSRRGRKPSSSSMSAAQRQKLYRERQAARIAHLEGEVEALSRLVSYYESRLENDRLLSSPDPLNDAYLG